MRTPLAPLLRGGDNAVSNKEILLKVHDAYQVYDKDLTVLAQNNRRISTKAEAVLWDNLLRKRQISGHKFLRQKPIANFILDFYCAKLLLGIEVDGDSHRDNKNYDEARSKALSLMDIMIIRYPNEDVLYNLEKVHDDLLERVKSREYEIQLSKQTLP